jgi:hypothetical protein
MRCHVASTVAQSGCFSWNRQIAVCCFEQPLPLLMLKCPYILGESLFLPSQ